MENLTISLFGKHHTALSLFVETETLHARLNNKVRKLSQKYAGTEAHAILFGEDDNLEDDNNDITDFDMGDENVSDEQEEKITVERTSPEELARTLTSLLHRLGDYKESIDDLSNELDRKTVFDIRYINDLIKDSDVEDFTSKTSVPLPTDFVKASAKLQHIFSALLAHNTKAFLKNAPDPDEVDLYDKVFSTDIKESFADLSIVKSEAGMPSFEGFEGVKILTLSGEVSTWTEYLTRLGELVEEFKMDSAIKYIDRIMSSVKELIKEEDLSEHIYPALNLLVSTMQQLVLAEITIKMFLARAIATIKKSLKVRSKTLDPSELDIF